MTCLEWRACATIGRFCKIGGRDIGGARIVLAGLGVTCQ